ncbi:NADP-specific glutamate dehydrogenase [uncultured Acetobacteroides sp.]|uniref:NADP-specific glutamate dehydrogenase n=1 Tax=uncultured Acetobacteroides sp. TaxID=1760811 RepID=UPI0029F4E872|nr:NADP-specific glutamate dehydrogenase [uncultured Acetobacteroides sp.]
MDVKKIMADLEQKHPGEKEYLQAVHEVLESIEEVYNQHPEFEAAKIVERIVEPDRIFTFRVTWVDDAGNVQTNLGYRVQFNSAIGPYKGGLRFHKAVTPSMLKFLGFEQTFKNALTTLPMGGGKGGSDFDPVGKSNAEVMRFCQAFMLELWRIIGNDTDVPAGDVGVGGREIGYLYGMYTKLAREYNVGVLTGKGTNWGGSLIRPEATGYGALYFVQHMLHKAGKDIKGKTVAVSGFGNVAWGAAQKATELGAKVIAVSGPDGVCHIPAGMTNDMIDYLLELRASNNNIVAPMAKKFSGITFTAGKKAWSVKCDIALPCAFQNECDGNDAKDLLANGTWCVAEVSNMGCTPEAIKAFQDAKIMFAPGKAVNAGGVATSGLEMTQNAMHISWTEAEVDAKLHQIMESIHEACVKYGTKKDGSVNYVDGANIAGFMKVASAMLEQGLI